MGLEKRILSNCYESRVWPVTYKPIAVTMYFIGTLVVILIFLDISCTLVANVNESLPCHCLQPIQHRNELHV